LTEDTSPVASTDFVMTYDASAAAAKKVLLSNVASASGGASRVLIGSVQTASNSSVIDFTSGLDDTYDHFEIIISNMKPASDDVEVWLRIGTGGGPTYQTSGYRYATQATHDGGTANAASTSDAKIILSGIGAASSVGNAAGEHYNAVVHFQNPEVTSDFVAFFAIGSYITGNSQYAVFHGGGMYATVGAITGIRFLFESGNIASGTFALYGYKKS
jgi:hypothetical protein